MNKDELIGQREGLEFALVIAEKQVETLKNQISKLNQEIEKEVQKNEMY